MNSTKLASIGLAAALAAVLPAIPAPAASLTRTFVSSAGSVPPVHHHAAVRHVCDAYAAVAANGIVTALDPGKYGPVTITGPVTINGNGWAAVTGPASGNAIIVNAVSGNVALNGLELDGAGTAANGIRFNSGDALEVTNCIARNFTASGLAFIPASSATFKVTNSEFDDNATQGIVIAPTGTAQGHGPSSIMSASITISSDLTCFPTAPRAERFPSLSTTA